ncbi:hypothetical protein TraAM80_00440 [Trypanosoma rangeli]|uniref:Uncharacterized protein n=1 Tax=Trypanosoma rangeli TaxID=5698 RepID=A0A3R7RT04_TRYRA|nr:uncharacterized protein TraAM80_00440 [Trypanosoma rangeli]RNF12292.1 hypothetical protein TraAM80_00440 [Trypanosoma rangeli]|eukprot:RNF12292.1 hypothetical protein TraAM80_00440 [Trypanosoma rangeli]
MSHEKAWLEAVDVILQWVMGALQGDANSIRLIAFLLKKLGDTPPQVPSQEGSCDSRCTGSRAAMQRILAEGKGASSDSAGLDTCSADCSERNYILNIQTDLFRSLFTSDVFSDMAKQVWPNMA